MGMGSFRGPAMSDAFGKYFTPTMNVLVIRPLSPPLESRSNHLMPLGEGALIISE
jgi:hypothetical protein